MTSVAGRADRFQRRHRWAGLPLAVLYKFIEDQGTYQAALLTYYGFVSLFPLLLLAVTVLGFVLSGNPAAQQAVLDSALRNVPVLGDQIGSNVHSLQGSVPALVVGIVVSLYGALGVTQSAFATMDQMWAVPVAERAGLPVTYGRGLLVLLSLGLGVLVTAGLAGLATAVGGHLPAGLTIAVRVVSTLVAVVLNAGLFLLGFRLLTSKHLGVRQIWPGAVAAAVGWQILLAVGTYLIKHQLQGSSASYGMFGIVLGLLTWIYLGAIVVLLCAEINTVRVLDLAPRSLLSVAAPDDDAVTDADRRAYTAYARTQRHKTFQHVEVSFDPDPGPDTGPIPGPASPPRTAGADGPGA